MLQSGECSGVFRDNKPVKEEGMFLTIMNLLVKMMSVPLAD
jgi:hypothetical protein